MKQMISLSIDLSKIDRSRIVAGKNGTSKYYGVTVLIEDVPDQYNKNCKVWQEQTKEERDSKAQKIFIGGGKTIWTEQPQQQNYQQQQQNNFTPPPVQNYPSYPAMPMQDESDLPF